ILFSGQSRDRTGDLRIFSPSLYQLSYLSSNEFRQSSSCLTPVNLPLVSKLPPRRATDRGRKQVLCRSTRHEQVYSFGSQEQAHKARQTVSRLPALSTRHKTMGQENPRPSPLLRPRG